MRRPFFFLLVDSWLASAGCAGVVPAGGVALESPGVSVAAGCVEFVAAGVASVAGVAPSG